LSYQVELEVFNGPMDLLLYLISKQEVNIHEISIANIVDQYMAYLEDMKALNVDISSDFIVMASTLMLIKSKSMLPTEEVDIEEEIDQQDELIQHLLEYKKIKILSRALHEKADQRNLLIPRPSHPGVSMEDSMEDDAYSYEELNLWDIIRAFAKIVKETGLDKSFQVIHSDKPLSSYIHSILSLLACESKVSFDALFISEKNRGDAICLFISLLELVKRSIVTVYQEQRMGALFINLNIPKTDLEALKYDGEYRINLLEETESSALSKVVGESGTERKAQQQEISSSQAELS
jgi:segregation and condensation protein A